MGYRYSFVYILIGVLLITGIRAARKWDYEPISITGYTSDESLMSYNISIDRIGRGEYGISGNADWKYDVTEETMVEGIAYRSSSGAESDYRVLPYSIPKQSFYEYLNTYYKDVIMRNVAHCSNIPTFKDKFQPPWPKKIYTAEKCVVDGEGLPEIVPPGFYKVIGNCTGPDQPTWSVTIVFKLTNKIF
ncbi:uncharacterized protein [Drosophila takahashii]|uniref:uncharacterized protein n=1 Tax=Drosophila takahashii TaxID=29030 RepID=UPI001CF92C55|nr:uncharacterized protein LOC108069257 [Drosophila takahashii]